MSRTIRRKRGSEAVDEADLTMGELRMMEVPMRSRTTTTRGSSAPFG
jgi:hypothetical protein